MLERTLRKDHTEVPRGKSSASAGAESASGLPPHAESRLPSGRVARPEGRRFITDTPSAIKPAERQMSVTSVISASRYRP